jgi:hypothetical protein
VASALSGAFGGLLAYAILYMDGVAGMSGWRWYETFLGITNVESEVANWHKKN